MFHSFVLARSFRPRRAAHYTNDYTYSLCICAKQKKTHPLSVAIRGNKSRAQRKKREKRTTRRRTQKNEGWSFRLCVLIPLNYWLMCVRTHYVHFDVSVCVCTRCICSSNTYARVFRAVCAGRRKWWKKYHRVAYEKNGRTQRQRRRRRARRRCRSLRRHPAGYCTHKDVQWHTMAKCW